MRENEKESKREREEREERRKEREKRPRESNRKERGIISSSSNGIELIGKKEYIRSSREKCAAASLSLELTTFDVI